MQSCAQVHVPFLSSTFVFVMHMCTLAFKQTVKVSSIEYLYLLN